MVGDGMIPFQLHRRIPLVRRPFFQRDRALSERNEALARSDQAMLERDAARRELENIQEERDRLRAEISALPRKRDCSFILPPGFVAFPVEGDEFQMVVEANDRSEYDQYVYQTRGYSELGRLFVRLLRGEGTLIDLGANIGTVCLPVAAAGNRVIAVEMLPANVLKLTLAGLVNRLPHLRVVQAAVTDAETIVGYVNESAWGQVSTSPTANQAVGLRLDTILNLIELDSPWFLRAPIAMKIDIEGHELAALQGAERLLRERRPIFVFEAIQAAYDGPGKTQAVKQLVCDYGYSLHIIRGQILSPHLPDDEQISLVSDILAVPYELGQFIIDRLSDYQMRPLSPAEQIAWLAEVAPQGALHRHHIAAIIPWMKRRLPNDIAELDQLAGSLSAHHADDPTPTG